MSSSYASKLKIVKTFCWLCGACFRRNFESPRMIAAIVWLLTMCTPLRKCTAGYIVSNLNPNSNFNSQSFPILRVEIENSPLQGYCEPVCVSIFWSIIDIAPFIYVLYWWQYCHQVLPFDLSFSLFVNFALWF